MHCDSDVICDQYGDHALSCPGGGGVKRRHDRLKTLVEFIARDAGLHVKPEPQHLLTSSNAKPADLFFPQLAFAGPTALDFTVVQPLVPDLNKFPLGLAGHGANLSWKRKCRASEEVCLQHGIKFIPIVFEHGGLIHRTSRHWLTVIIDCYAVRHNLLREATRNRCFGSLSTALHYEKADIILRRLTNRALPPSERSKYVPMRHSFSVLNPDCYVLDHIDMYH
jgi:hypothetical protein